MKKALVFGGGGFIGSHLVTRLVKEGFWVRAVDVKLPEFSESRADDFIIGDLRDVNVSKSALDTNFDEIYQLAADMGGTGFIGTGDNDADILHNSATINLNVLNSCEATKQTGNIFYSSSACVYPERNQMDPNNPNCEESTTYPANPDTEYGWEKLFSERLYLTYRANKGLKTFVARYHNIFGPDGTWNGGREKVPAAICRKVAHANDGESVEIWGDGEQTRSFLYIEHCLEGTTRLIRSNFFGPVNIGSDRLISINSLVDMVVKISKKTLGKNYIDGPQGVRGRVSDNKLILQKLKWSPSSELQEGLTHTYNWISSQINKDRL